MATPLHNNINASYSVHYAIVRNNNNIDCGIVFHAVQMVASDEHPLEILLESASEGRMAKLIMILRDGLTGSIDVSHYVCNTS